MTAVLLAAHLSIQNTYVSLMTIISLVSLVRRGQYSSLFSVLSDVASSLFSAASCAVFVWWYDVLEPQQTCRSQGIALGNSFYRHPFGTGMFVVSSRLSWPTSSRDSPAFHLTIGALGFQMHAIAFSSTSFLGKWPSVLILAWQELYPLSGYPRPRGWTSTLKTYILVGEPQRA